MLKFYVNIFYVMGKALSGELSCPFDRSCYAPGTIVRGHYVLPLSVHPFLLKSLCNPLLP